MLYGRMGYISALLFVNKNFGEEKIPQSHIQQVQCFCVSGIFLGSHFLSAETVGFVSLASTSQVAGREDVP